MSQGLHHIAVKVVDLIRAEAFYHGLLSLPMVKRHQDAQGAHRSTWLDLGGTLLMLERTTPAEHAPNGWHLVALRIAASERAACAAQLRQLGIPITGETDYSLYFEDPEGNRLAYSHWPETKP